MSVWKILLTFIHRCFNNDAAIHKTLVVICNDAIIYKTLVVLIIDEIIHRASVVIYNNL